MRLLRAVPVLATSVVLLTGCGVAGTQFHPGVAAQVGDETITTRHVDQVTHDYCGALEKVSKDQPPSDSIQQTPLRYFAHRFATTLIEQAAAEQLADDYDVTPTSAYKGGLAQLEPQLVNLDEDQKDAVREVVGASGYTDDVLTQIGASKLHDQGKDDATVDDQLAEGRKVLQDWVADNDVEINPKYAVEIGNAAQVDTDLSYPLGATARSGLSGPPDETKPDPAQDEQWADYVAALPDNLVCLD